MTHKEHSALVITLITGEDIVLVSTPMKPTDKPIDKLPKLTKMNEKYLDKHKLSETDIKSVKTKRAFMYKVKVDTPTLDGKIKRKDAKIYTFADKTDMFIMKHPDSFNPTRLTEVRDNDYTTETIMLGAHYSHDKSKVTNHWNNKYHHKGVIVHEIAISYPEKEVLND